MHLVKFIRRHKGWLFAVIGIIVMLGFIAGPFIDWMTGNARPGDKTAAYIFDEELGSNEVSNAASELSLLKSLRADFLLQNIPLPFTESPDLKALLLSELLFGDRSISPMIIEEIKKVISRNEYRISQQQIDAIYTQTETPGIYWLALSREAANAGFATSNQEARAILESFLPRVYQGASFAQVMGQLIEQTGAPQENIESIFGRFIAVLNYANFVCQGNQLTTQQIMHLIANEVEKVDANFVNIPLAPFMSDANEISPEMVQKQFEQYNNTLPGIVDAENEYGFGYKLPDRIQLDYIVLQTSDISSIVPQPTQDQVEQFYQQNRQQFVEKIPADPNDPNSTETNRQMAFAEVEDSIKQSIFRNQVNIKSELILQEALKIAESNYQADSSAMTVEQRKELAVAYSDAAAKLEEKYGIKLYTGTTGLLSYMNISQDMVLASLEMRGNAQNSVPLVKVLFAAEGLNKSNLGPFEPEKPKLHENLGPLRSRYGNSMAIVKLVEVLPAQAPQDINVTFSTAGISLNLPVDPNNNVFSVREQVVEDLKNLSAMKTAKEKAQELVNLVAENGWDAALVTFNSSYGTENEPNTFKIDNSTFSRISDYKIQMLKKQLEGNPAQDLIVNNYVGGQVLSDKFYSIVPADANSVTDVRTIIEYKPQMSFYVVKDMNINRLSMQVYENVKPMAAHQFSTLESQAMAPVHYNPTNILKRTGFRWVEAEQVQEDEQNAVLDTENADSAGETVE